MLFRSIGNGSFEDVLYSQGAKFNAAAGLDGDGVVTNLDLIAVGPELVAGGAGAGALSAYNSLLIRRGNVNGDATTDAADVAALYDNFGSTATWLLDLNVDGVIDVEDVRTLVGDLARTSFADFNLDGRVDGADFMIWQRGLTAGLGQFHWGDANLDGVVDHVDLAVWQADFGQVAPLVNSLAATAAVPEPAAAVLLVWGAAVLGCRTSRKTRSVASQDNYQPRSPAVSGVAVHQR